MAAYADVASVMNIISQLQTHPSPPISLDDKQIKSLTQNFAYLQEYLESYPPNGARSKDADGLESFIADTAYQVQDMIEAHLVDQIQVHREKIMSFDLYEGLHNMILEMELLIKKKVFEITSTPFVPTRRSPYPTAQSTVVNVGFERALIAVMDKLTRQQSGQQIVPIVGMGGIGKTTLATGVYTNPLVVQHFDFRAWATIYVSGFLKPLDGKSWEECAKEYLNDLIERNLILVHKLGSDGNIKLCTIHDLLRDLCIKEAEKDNFFCNITNTHSLNIEQSWQTQRRIGIHGSTLGRNEILQALGKEVLSSSWARSLMCNVEGVVLALPVRLLSVFSAIDEFKFVDPKKRNLYPLEDIFQLVNLRHLVIAARLPATSFPPSVYRLWNLQTLAVVHSENVVRYHCPSPIFDIWKMPQLRHVTINYFDIPDPPGEDDCVVLKNLQTLSKVHCFKCGEENPQYQQTEDILWHDYGITTSLLSR